MPVRPPPPRIPFDSVRALPTDVERWWVAEAQALAPRSTEPEALRRLAPRVQRLSDAFTASRPPTFGNYARDAEDRLAYGLWYFPQSWVRTRLPLAEARAVRGYAPPGDRRLRVLDVGAGSGAAGLSAATWLASLPGGRPVDLVALDHAPQALECLRRLANEALPAAVRPEVRTATHDLRQPSEWPTCAAGPFDVVIASFVLNELAASDPAGSRSWLEGLSKRLTPEGLLLIVEPAVKPDAARLAGLAADLVEHAGLAPWGPQLHGGPWRPAPDKRTWMHEVRRWRAPRSLSILNHTLWRSMAELTFSYALLSPTAPPPWGDAADSPCLLRVASPVRTLKGRLTWLGVSAAGRLGEYEVQTRDLAEGEKARFLAFERGDVLDCAELKPLGRPDAWRLPSGSALRRHLSPAAGA